MTTNWIKAIAGHSRKTLGDVQSFSCISTSSGTVYKVTYSDMTLSIGSDLTSDSLGNRPSEVMGAWRQVEIGNSSDERAFQYESTVTRNVRSHDSMLVPGWKVACLISVLYKCIGFVVVTDRTPMFGFSGGETS